MPESPAVVVVAAVIERDGRILIGQRKAGGRHPLKWEFPGGKVEPGEEPRAALVRELREELGIGASIGELLDSYDVRYADGPLTRLLFYAVTDFAPEPRNLDFAQIVWEERSRLAVYDFLEGDVRFVARLAARAVYR
jgi:8-oxo-dGTP diphosphatase